MKEQFKDKLLFAMKKKGMSQSGLANATGITASSISDWINGRYIPKQDKIYLLANALNVKPSFLLGYYDEEINVDAIIRSLPNYVEVHKSKIVPLLGGICAGDGIWCEENYEGHIVVDNRFRVDFALNVKGDSMTGANINDGDIALFQKCTVVDNGQIAAVLLKEDNLVTLKKVFNKEDGLRLVPTNEAYDPIETQDGIVLGKFVGIYYKEMI